MCNPTAGISHRRDKYLFPTCSFPCRCVEFGPQRARPFRLWSQCVARVLFCAMCWLCVLCVVCCAYWVCVEQVWYADAPSGDAFGTYNLVGLGAGVSAAADYITFVNKPENIDNQVRQMASLLESVRAALTCCAVSSTCSGVC